VDDADFSKARREKTDGSDITIAITSYKEQV